MHARLRAGALTGSLGLLASCAGPLDPLLEPLGGTPTHRRSIGQLDSAYRTTDAPTNAGDGALSDDGALPRDGMGPDDYVRYALFHSPEVESAYQIWRAASERPAQARALPDPRLKVGFFLDEVETRVGPQQARVGVSQTFPWPGTLDGRQDAARHAALAAWRGFEHARLVVTQRVVEALHELRYLDAAIGITTENLDLLRSFEEMVRARYRVGAGSHPQLIRVQVELGQLEDHLAQLRAMRPAYVARLNAALKSVLRRQCHRIVQRRQAIFARRRITISKQPQCRLIGNQQVFRLRRTSGGKLFKTHLRV